MAYTLVLILVEFVFFIIALTHIYWAISITNIPKKVIPHINDNPVFIPMRSVTFLVGIIFILLAIFILAMANGCYGGSLNWFYNFIGSCLALIFFARSIGDFKFVGFLKKIKNSQFAFYDTRYWSPLCFLLAFLLLYLTWYR